MRALLTISLAGNVLLGLLLWTRPPITAANARGNADSTRLTGEIAPDQIPPPLRVLTRPASRPSPWSAIDTDSVDEFLARLRATGCPESTQRDLVTLRLARRHRERDLDLDHQIQHLTPWWRSRVTGSLSKEVRALNQARRSLRQEFDAELERLFGEPADGVRDRVVGVAFLRREAYLPADQQCLLNDVEREFKERHAKLDARFPQPLSFTSPALQEQRAALGREREAAIAATLSPEARQEYLMRHSPAARYVLSELPPVDSEEEFRRLVQLAIEAGMTPPPFTTGDRYGIGTPTGQASPELESWREKEAAFKQQLEALQNPPN